MSAYTPRKRDMSKIYLCVSRTSFENTAIFQMLALFLFHFPLRMGKASQIAL